MAYNPNIYMPYQPQGNMTIQPINGLVSVTGIDGAKAYQLPPNSSMPLFDANDDILYLKTTDAGGFPTLKAFAFTPIEQSQEQQTQGYVTREDFEALEARVNELSKPQQRQQRRAADNG